jgi:protein TonB
VALHAGLVLVATVVGARVVRHVTSAAPVTQMVDVDLPPPAPEEKPVEKAPAPAPAVRAHAAKVADAPPPPPAAAQAGQVLTAPDEVVDFGETVVAGAGDSFAGGVTEAGGTAKHAVRDPGARAGGVEGGTGTDPAGDRSRPPSLAAGNEWDCPFPPEADDAGIDHAVVTLRISVTADGHVQEVRATSDPGNGFGREARACALSKPWTPALDRAGRAMAAFTLVNVRFDR